MALKMLLAPKEGACVLGPNGANSKQISDMTGVRRGLGPMTQGLARLHLSSKGEYYPGTNMQELWDECVQVSG